MLPRACIICTVCHLLYFTKNLHFAYIAVFYYSSVFQYNITQLVFKIEGFVFTDVWEINLYMYILSILCLKDYCVKFTILTNLS